MHWVHVQKVKWLLAIGSRNIDAMAASQISYYQRVQALTEEICRHHPYQEGSDPRIGAAIEDLKKASDNLRKANI